MQCSRYFTKSSVSIPFFLAKELNYSVSNEYELIEFLNTIDVNLLLKKTFEPVFINTNGSKVTSRRWTPVVEGISFVFLFLHLIFFQISFCF